MPIKKDLNKLPKSKEAASKFNLKTYFDGTICVQGHKEDRYVSGGCVPCALARAIKRTPIDRKKRKQKTQNILKLISRVCKRRLCDNIFTPKKRKDQIFCSERCTDINGKEEWKKRNKKNYLKLERNRKKNKYAKDENYADKLRLRSNKTYHKLTDDQKFERNKKHREKVDPIKRRKYFSAYQNKRNKEDIDHRLSGSLRARLRAALKAKNATKSFRTIELIGCTVKELKKHLESKFSIGMNWKNYGKWHVDHIEPINSFDLKKINKQLECFHYSNLQPLWAQANLRKGSKKLQLYSNS